MGKLQAFHKCLKVIRGLACCADASLSVQDSEVWRHCEEHGSSSCVVGFGLEPMQILMAVNRVKSERQAAARFAEAIKDEREAPTIIMDELQLYRDIDEGRVRQGEDARRDRERQRMMLVDGWQGDWQPGDEWGDAAWRLAVQERVPGGSLIIARVYHCKVNRGTDHEWGGVLQVQGKEDVDIDDSRVFGPTPFEVADALRPKGEALAEVLEGMRG